MEEHAMEEAVRALFTRYEATFGRALAGKVEMDEVLTLYASDFIAASPTGVTSGKNDDALRQVMAKGYEHYRAIGTRQMKLRDLRLSPIDDCHCMAHAAWTATYARKGQADTSIDFDVHYLVQVVGGEAKVFGWISGDEQALLKEHGII